MNRDTIRKKVREQRRALTPLHCEQLSVNIAHHLMNHKLFLQSKHIAFYFSNDGEVDPQALLHHAWSMHKICYLPVTHPVKHKQLCLVRYRPDDVLKTNKFGIPEPKITTKNLTPSWALDLVLMPLVAFDLQGNRLGMGGGYYDRTFAFTKSCSRSTPRLVGLAYEFQKVNTLKPESWDVPLDAVATEKTFYTIDKI